jgi:hypothetical protein
MAGKKPRNGRKRAKCGGKIRHANKAAANRSAEDRLSSPNNPPLALRAYHCPRCKGFHLTSSVD